MLGRANMTAWKSDTQDNFIMGLEKQKVRLFASFE
jgi:hypothetical protein